MLLLLLILYSLAMHFLLSPLDVYYIGTYQSLLAPVSLIPIFYFQSYDILFMGIHTLLLNLYTAYYVIDPESQENYS